MKKLILLVLVLAVSGAASAAIITGVVRAGGASSDRDPIGVYDGSTAPLATEAGGLKDGNGVFSDRTYPWASTPISLIGVEYIRTFNNDKNEQSTVTYTVTLSEAALVGVTVDDRFPPDKGIPLQDVADGIVADFAAAGTFTDTTWDLFIRERSDGSRDRPMSVFAAQLDAGTYVFHGVPSGKNFMSIIAIPEPATMLLLGLGGLLIRRRR